MTTARLQGPQCLAPYQILNDVQGVYNSFQLIQKHLVFYLVILSQHGILYMVVGRGMYIILLF